MKTKIVKAFGYFKTEYIFLFTTQFFEKKMGWLPGFAQTNIPSYPSIMGYAFSIVKQLTTQQFVITLLN